MQSITLFIFGGVSTIAGEAERALDEFLIAVVGPVSSFASVRRIMASVPLKTVSVEADLAAALQLMVKDTLNQVPVLRAARVVGLLKRADVLRFLQLRDELHLAGDDRPSVGRPRQMVKEV